MDNYNLRISNLIDSKFNFLMGNPNVCGISHGYKTVNNKTTNIPSLIFFVKKKFNSSAINPYYLIPKTMNGVITDVVEVGKFEYCNGPPKPAIPLRPGFTIQNPYNSTPGIVSCALRTENGRVLLLTAGHVVRAENEKNANCIVQPKLTPDEKPGARIDKALKNIFYLSDVKTVPKTQLVSPPEAYNSYDLAMLEVGTYDPKTLSIILSPMPSKELWFGNIIEIAGKTSIVDPLEMVNTTIGARSNKGMLRCLNMTFEVENKERKTLYKNHIAIKGIDVLPGDSGSMIVVRGDDDNNRLNIIGMVMGRAMVGKSATESIYTVVTPLHGLIAEFTHKIGTTAFDVALIRDP